MFLLDRFLRRETPDCGGVRFLHKTPAVPNIGDILCTPKNYFEFSSERSVLIVGGGAFRGIGYKVASEHRASIRIAWGIGQSWMLETPPKALNERRIRRVYTVATTRDPNYVTAGIPLMPCVSVLHPIVDIPPGKRDGLFLNQAEAASGGLVDAILRGHPDIVTASNAMPETEFMERFSQTETITTNSYHAAYWGLLSGRGVKLIGYSTKFLELLALFNLPASHLTRYQRGNGEALRSAVTAAIKTPAVYADIGKRPLFRDMNLSFAASLGALGVAANRVQRLEAAI